MRIISWNCNMAFRNKYELIFDLNPDIIFLQECEHKEILEKEINPNLYHQILWYGDNKHKGVAIINRTDFNISKKKNHNPNFKYIIPYTIHTDPETNLYLVWAMQHPGSSTKSYIGQVWQAINNYELKAAQTNLLIGDFNSNKLWDKSRQIGNHSAVVEYLKEKKIVSLYHVQNHLEHGNEPDPTLYMYRHIDKPYHMDYCFLSESLRTDSTRIKIGKAEKWLPFSDHMPLIIDDINVKDKI